MTGPMLSALYLFASATMPIVAALVAGKFRLSIPESASRADGLSLTDLFGKDTFASVLATVALVSVLEELIFRGLGSYVFGRSWIAGAFIALAFSLVHAIPPGKWLPIRIPVAQLLAGLWFWAGLRMSGLLLAVAAHVLVNVIIFSSLYVLHKRFGVPLGD